jgi:ADP-ribosylglycohydrolase
MTTITNDQRIPILNIVNTIAVADALGGGLEMESAESLVSTDLSRYYERGNNPTYNSGYKPGMITDDTWMTLGLMTAVTKANSNLSFELLLASYQAMYDKETQLIAEKKGKWWGGIEPVLQGQIDFVSWRSDKLASITNPSNGSVMRAHILGYLKDENLIANFAEQDALFSHPHPVAADCSRVLALLVHRIVYKKLPVQEVIKEAIQIAKEARVKSYLTRLDALPFVHVPIETTKLVCVEDDTNATTAAYMLRKGGIGVPCNALLTLGASLYVVKHVAGVLPAMQYAIKMGGDVDSTAVVVTSLTVAKTITKPDTTEDPVLADLKSKLHFQEVLGEIASQFDAFLSKQ